jgi:cell division septum initiation protein DivIVA
VKDEALRRADELLSELIEVVETARAVPMSASCVLPREHVLDLLDELREVLPPEMDDARTLIATRDRVLKEAYEAAAGTRATAVTEADAVIAEAQRQAEQVEEAAQGRAAEMIRAAEVQHARLVASTTVHQAAAAAATALRQDAEQYQAQLSAEAQGHDARVRAEADRYAHDARTEAERYATKLTADAEGYAERTLDELAGVLHKAAATAEQGTVALRQRRASAWTTIGGTTIGGSDSAERPPMSA